MGTNGYFEFLTYFVDLEDPRVDRGNNHLLIDMVGLVLCGTICGADIERFCKAHQGWFEQFLELPHGIPSHDTMGRVFSLLDTEQLQQCLAAWVEHLQFCLDGQTVAIDGKTLRGSHDKTAGVKPLHVVNVWANQVKFCLGQVSVSEKSNEIPAVQELLEILNLKGAVVTADAMHCQKKTAKKIVEAEADYLLQVKNNQPTLMQTIADVFEKHEADTFQAKSVRCCTTTERNRTREHWSIENTLHHTLDVTFAEDRSRIRKGNGPEIISVFRRLALSILKADTTIKDNVRGKRLTAGWNLDNLKGILLAFQAV